MKQAACPKSRGSASQRSPPFAMRPPIKILAIIEATTVIGPAKNLLKFCRMVRSAEFCVDGAPPVEVSIVTFERPVSGPRAVATGSPAPNAFVEAAREQGVTVDVIQERFRFDPRALTELRRIVERRAPDIIQTHMIKSHFLVKLSGLGKKYPWAAYHHGYTTTDLKMRFYNQLNRWSLPSANRVITVCEAFAEQLTRAGVRTEQIRVRHNSVVPPRKVSPAERRALRTQFNIGEDEQVILAVGRFSQEKGHADLLHALAVLREIDAELKFKLLLVGDGPEREQLENVVKLLALSDQVVFAGHTSDVAPYYAIADVLALPSHSEGSPNVLLEAMAAGLPIVATSVGGVPEIAADEVNALLVPARDPAAFGQSLQRALKQPGLAEKLKSNALARAREFSPESQARSLIQIYQELLSPRMKESSSNTQPRLNDPLAIARGTDTI
jgi:glycosyltransferase involved in cell wall biosynthesis